MLKTINLKQLFFLSGLFLFCFTPSLINAQTILKGAVSDSANNEKLPGVVVSVDSSNTVATDIHGRYEMNIPKGEHHISITYFGYATIRNKFTATRDSMTLDFRLPSLTQDINPVVVSASMYGKNLAEENVSMEVLKAKTIENTGAVQVDEALNNVPGVNITSDGQANIRGGSGWAYGAGSRVLMLVDGLPELTADAADVIWDFLPIEEVQQVEVIKDASSVLYGSGALDGVINLRTTVPGPVPQTTFNIFEGVYGNPEVDSVPWKAGQAPGFQGFTFMHSQQFGRLDLITSGDVYNETSYLQGQYYQRIRGSINARYRFKKIDGLIAGIRVNEMYNNEALFLVWANDKSKILQPLGGDTGKNASIVPGRFLREAIDPYITYYTPDGGKINLQGRYFVSNNEDYGATDKGSRSQLRYSELTYQKTFTKIRFTFTAGAVASGVEVAAQLYGSHEGTNVAGYLQLEKKLGKLILTAGVRKEQFHEDSVNASSPLVFRAGGNYELFKYTHIRASYGEGYRFPSIAERFIRTSVAGFNIFPNPAILPEKAYSSEVGINQGLKFGSWLASIDLAAFQTIYNNLIDFTYGVYVPPGTVPTLADVGFKSLNVENALIQGRELSIEAEGKIFGAPVTFMVGFTSINPINVDKRNFVNTYESKHPDLTGTQKDSLKSTEILNYRSLYTGKAGFEVFIHKFSFGVNARYMSNQVNIDSIFAVRPPKHIVIQGIEDFRLTHAAGSLIYDTHIALEISPVVRIAFLVKNFFNTLYTDRPGMIDPPRTFMVQSTIKI